MIWESISKSAIESQDDSKDNKISDTITLLDIRKRFDFYVGKDSCTGFIVEDFDNLISPPFPN